MATVLVRWKTYDGMEFLFIQTPGTGAYVSTSELTPASHHEGHVVNERVHTVPRHGRYAKTGTARRAGQVAPLRTPFPAKTPVWSGHEVRPGPAFRGQSPAGGEALAEVALRTSTFLHDWSVRKALWDEIVSLESPIIRAIREYGGVLVVGRVIMWDHPEANTGVTPTLFKDAYLSDAGKSYDALVEESGYAPRADGQPVISARGQAVMRATKFRPPPQLNVPDGWVQGRFLVWARPQAGHRV